MPYADIIILALVAGFILLRLRHVLGQKTGRDRPDDYTPASFTEEETVVTLPERRQLRQAENEELAQAQAPSDEKAAPGLADIRGADASFDASRFLEGARAAFEMVFDAFNKGDRQTLKSLLSAPIYEDFAAALESRQKEENQPETTLIAVESMRIAEAEKKGNLARITVKFSSEQITVTRDKEGKIVEGDPSQVDTVEDEWVFERDVTSRNPNWKVVSV